MLPFDWSDSLEENYNITIEYTFGTSIQLQILFMPMSPGIDRE